MIPVINSVRQVEVSVKLLDSSNGLLLMCSVDESNSQVLDYFVCNPLTKKWVGLPKVLSQPKWVKAVIMVDGDSGNYFVVRVVQLTGRSKVFNFEVFSSESGQWKYVKVCCNRSIRFFVMKRHTVCYNGMIHLLVDNYTILAFDPRSDASKCRLINLPSDRVSRFVGVIGVSCGFMRYVEVADAYLEPTQARSLGVWLLKDYDAGEWILQHRIELTEFCSSDPRIDLMFSGMGATRRGVAFHPFTYDIVYLSCSCHLICCQLSTKMVELVECASNEIRDSFYNFEVFPFVLPPWPTPVSRRIRVDKSMVPLLVEIPDPMLTQILLKLPLKTIFRFKAVSKHWFSLISDPLFAHSYTCRINTENRNSPPWAIFSSLDQMGLQERVYMRDPQLASTNFSLQFLGPAIAQRPEVSTKLLDSSNGLLLLCSLSDDSQILDYYVCNPLTLKWVCLPQTLSQPKWVKAAFLVEKDSGHYLVVRVAELLWRSKVFNFEIFSSKLGEWRYLKMNCPRRIKHFVKSRHTVCYRGIIHWLVDYYTILAFDPKSNTNDCRFIDLPRDRESTHVGVLGVSCGMLRYMEVSDNDFEEFREQSIGVWTLVDYDAGEWFLEYRIQLNEFGSCDDSWDPDTAFVTRPLGFHPFDSDVLFLDQRRRLYCCNVSTRLVELVDCESHLNYSLYKFEMFPFVLPLWPTPVPQPSWETDRSAD